MQIHPGEDYIQRQTGRNNFKGALDIFNLILPICLKKVEIFVPLEVFTYVVTTWSILLATLAQFTKIIYEFFIQ